MIDPHEEAKVAIVALPPQPQSFTPGLVHGQDYNEVMDFLRREMLASLAIPQHILCDGATDYSGFLRVNSTRPDCPATLQIIEVER